MNNIRYATLAIPQAPTSFIKKKEKKKAPTSH